MIRKITLALIAAASLTIGAVAPASAAPPATCTKMPPASCGGFHQGGHWGHGSSYGGYGSGTSFVNGLSPAVWVGAVLVGVAAVVALAIPVPRRARRPEAALESA